MNLTNLDLDPYFINQFKKFEEQGYSLTRVAQKHKNNYLLLGIDGYINGKLSGKMRYLAESKKDLPAVGDWVIVKKTTDSIQAIIYDMLQRKTCFTRKAAISGGRKIKNGIIVGGSTEEQVIAANIDIAFIVSGLDENFNLHRIERYLTLTYNSGAKPVILLNKCDCCCEDEIMDRVAQVDKIAFGVPVHPISVIQDIGMDIFELYMKPGASVVFLGSSGVGKSTITNYLLGEDKQKTSSVSTSTSKGRHTTTSSELILHKSGCMIIDTPGIRELQLWSSPDALEVSFEDVIRIINNCKYTDCSHTTEPGCAVNAAIESGVLEKSRFNSFLSQYHELKRLDGRIKETQVYLSKRDKLKAKLKYQGHK